MIQPTVEILKEAREELCDVKEVSKEDFDLETEDCDLASQNFGSDFDYEDDWDYEDSDEFVD